MRVHAPSFSLKQTLESGQLFRFKEVEDGFIVSHRDKAFVISQQGDELIVHAATPNVSEPWLRFFFALDDLAPKGVDEFSSAAIAYCSGMRVCRQDPWECTIGFICSQNNNVKRIRQLMDGLAKAYGEEVKVGKHIAYLFPNPREIRFDDSLHSIKAGYRARYLVQASDSLTDEWLESLAELSYPAAKKWLLTIKGVGPKVADCILLFAYQHRNSFPIDTWMEQIMREEYGIRKKSNMQRAALKRFGADAGIMQQYLFHYKRKSN